MAVETNQNALAFQNLQLHDPVWLHPKPWECMYSESGSLYNDGVTIESSTSQQSIYPRNMVSEESLVRLAMNAMCGIQSALVSIEKISATFLMEPADRSFHRVTCLWSRSLSTHALGGLLRSVGYSGFLVFLLSEFVNHFKTSNFEENGVEYPKVLENMLRESNLCSRKSKGEFGPGNLVSQAFAVAVGKVLDGFISALNTLHSSVTVRRTSNGVTSLTSSEVGCLTSTVHCDVTLLEVYAHTRELRTRIEAIGNICNLHHAALHFSESPLDFLVDMAREDFRNFPRGGDLLSYLYSLMQVVDAPQYTLLKFLFLHACEPYFGFVRSWIYKAEITDPFNEFAIGFTNNSFHNSSDQAIMPVDSVVKNIQERDNVTIPCFLQDYLHPILRAGQQLQVVLKLLELCNYVATGDNSSYGDILPHWVDFLDKVSPMDSSMTINKESIDAMVVSRNSFYERMWQNLENNLQILKDRWRMDVTFGTVPLSPSDIISDVPVSLESGNLQSISSAQKSNANLSSSYGGYDLSTVKDVNYEENQLAPSECSSMSLGEEDVNEDLSYLINDTVMPQQDYFNILQFSFGSINLLSSQCLSETWKMGHKRDVTASDPSSLNGAIQESRCNKTNRTCDSLAPGEPSFCSHEISQAQMFDADTHSGCSWLQKKPFHVDFGPGARTLGTLSKHIMGSNGESNFDSCMLEAIFRKDECQGDSFSVTSQSSLCTRNWLSLNPLLSSRVVPSHYRPTHTDMCNKDDKHNFSSFEFFSVRNPCMNFVEKSDPICSFSDKFVTPYTSRACDSRSMDSIPNKEPCFELDLLSDPIECNANDVVLPHNFSKTCLNNFPSEAIDQDHCSQENSSLSSAFEMPIDFIIGKCLLQEIQLQYKYISQLTIHLLKDGFHLEEHLQTLRRYHFMELADWADLFVISLLCHTQKQKLLETDQIISEIQGLLRMSIQKSSCASALANNRLYIYKKVDIEMPSCIMASCVPLTLLA